MARMQHRVAPVIGSGGANLPQCIHMFLLLFLFPYFFFVFLFSLLIITIALFLPTAWEAGSEACREEWCHEELPSI